MATPPHTATTILAVSKIDKACIEAVGAAGGQISRVETSVLPTLFLVTLPANATVASTVSRKRYDIAMEAGGYDHIMILEASPDIQASTLRYVDCFEMSTDPLTVLRAALDTDDESR